jgi:hypothetical protein
MRCLGPAILNFAQQRNLETGKPVLVVRETVFPDAAERAIVGDLWWVKEDFIEVVSAQFEGPSCVSAIVPGSPLGMSIPMELRAWWHVYKRYQRQGKDLSRSASRAYLRIGSISHMGFHCTGHMQNIDDFLGKKSAAA